MSVEHVDVLIVGAGLSGIGAGYHLQVDCPDKDVRDARGPGSHWRGLGSIQVSGHPVGLGHVQRAGRIEFSTIGPVLDAVHVAA